MKVIVTASHRPDHQGVWTPQTLWMSSKPTHVEVLDQDDDPPCDKRTAEQPGIIAFDGYQIGRKTLAMLRSTPLLVVSGADQTNAIEVTAQLAEANEAHKKEAARLQGIIDEQAKEILRLKPFEDRGAEQEQTIADLRARLGRKADKPAQAQQGARP
jgi:hypothetical protein